MHPLVRLPHSNSSSSRACYSAAFGGDVLHLADGAAYLDQTITLPVTVVGSPLVFFTGTTLQIGTSGTPVSGVVVLDGIHFLNSADMQVWLATQTDTLTLKNVIFEGCGAINGAVHFETDGTLIAEKSTWMNSTYRGINSPSAAVNTHLLIYDSIFKNIDIGGGYGAGILSWASGNSVTVHNSTFTRLYGAYGAGMWLKAIGDLEVVDSVFSECICTGNGGAIVFDGVSSMVSGSTFANNHGDYGGAIYIAPFTGTVHFTSCAFTQNHATTTGGAMYKWSGTVTLSNIVWCLNSAPSDGTASLTLVAVSCTDCTLDSDDCCPDGYFLNRVDDNTVSCEPIMDVFASESGVGDCMTAGTPCSLADAYSLVLADGTIHLAGDTFTSGLTLLKPVNIIGTDSTIFNSDTLQVGLTGTRLTSLSIENVRFQNIIISMEIWLASETDSLTLTNVIFTGCGGPGGAVHMQTPGTLVVDKCVWMDATKRGIMLPPSIHNQHLYMTNSTMINLATPSSNGVGIYSYGSDCITSIHNSSFINLSSDTGGVYVWDGSLEIVDCLFKGCTALDGSAIYRQAGTSTLISGSTFVNNQATNDGTILLTTAPSVQVEECSFLSNNADAGGGIFQDGGDVTLTNSEFCLNTATTDPNSSPSTLATACGDCSIDGLDCCQAGYYLDRLDSSTVTCEPIMEVFASDSGAGDCMTVGTPCSLTTAYSTVLPGGTIFMSPGTYSTRVTVRKTLSFIGNDPNAVIFSPYPGGVFIGSSGDPLSGAVMLDSLQFAASPIDIYFASETDTLTVINCIFDGAQMAAPEGHLRLRTFATIVIDRAFVQNSRTAFVSMKSGAGHLFMTNSRFQHSSWYGGGTINNLEVGSTLEITNCTFIDSNSTQNGGAIYTRGASYVHINDSSFISCHSVEEIHNGGAVYVYQTSSFLSFRNTFIRNSAPQCGALGLSQCTIGMSTDDTFIENQSEGEGTVWVNVTPLRLKNTVFCLNTAQVMPNTRPESYLTTCIADEKGCTADAADCCEDPLEAPLRTGPDSVVCDCILKAVGGSCVTECPSDEYDFGDRNCHGCVADFGSGCNQCNTTYGCDDCTGLLSLVEPHSCLSECPDDQYDLGNGFCGDCDSEFGLSGAGTDTCLNCTVAGCNNAGCDGHLSIASPKLCLSGCPALEYHHPDGNCHYCTDFGVGCTVCSEVAGCATCSNVLSMDSQALCLSECPYGQYGDGGQCKSCNTEFGVSAQCDNCTLLDGCSNEGCHGLLKYATPHDCVSSCPIGEYDNEDGTCGDCDASFSDGATCSECDINGCSTCAGVLSMDSITKCLDQCPYGQYDDAGSCQLCSAFDGEMKCYECTDSGCSNCTGFSSMETPATCLSECPWNQYANEIDECQSCNTGFSISAQCDNCTLLDGCSNEGCHGLLEYSTPHDCVSSCPIGEYDNEDGTCGDCDTSFGTGSGVTNAILCDQCTINGCENVGCAGYLSTDVNPVCLSICPTDEYDNQDGTCQPCTDFAPETAVCSECVKATGCFDCTGVLSNTSIHQCLDACEWNEYAFNGQCYSCDASFGITAQCDNCTEATGCSNEGCSGVISYDSPHFCYNVCPLDEFDNEDGTCGDCDTSFGTGSGVTNAILCDQCTINGCENVGCTGHLSTGSIKYCLSDCQLDEYKHSDGTCHPCNPDFSPDSGATCSTCNAINGCTSCDQLYSMNPIKMCIPTCPSDQYDLTNGNCGDCSDFGNLCNHCNFTLGCFNDGCSLLLSMDPKAMCINSCNPPTDQYDAGDGTCQACSDFTDTHTCTECNKDDGCIPTGCVSNYLSPDMPKNCMDACKTNQYIFSAGQCNSCTDFGSGCTLCNNIQGCTTCPSGTLSMDTKSICLVQCPSGEFDSGNNQCQNCSINCEDVCNPEGGDCTCKDSFCGDQCMDEFDKCDKCGGDGSSCEKDTVQDPFAALGPNGQFIAIGGAGLILLVFLAMAIALIALRVRMKRKEHEKIVAASAGVFVTSGSGAETLGSTVDVALFNGDSVLSGESTQLGTLDMMSSADNSWQSVV